MPNDSSTSSNSTASDPEIERLKERLSFYESFDQLIQSNVSQAGSLLREAVDLRENAATDADNAKHQIEAERTANRERYRALFSAMLDEITSLQGQAERLARRLTDAIDQLESELSPGAEFPSLPSNLTAELKFGAEIPEDGGEAELAVRLDDSLAAQQGDAVALGAGPTVADPTVDDAVRNPDPAGQHAIAIHDLTPIEPADQRDLDSADDVVDAIDSQATPQRELKSENEGLEAAIEPVSDPDDAILDSPGEPPTAAVSDQEHDPHESKRAKADVESQFILLVHRVPRAATALSLKRHLETLEHVLVVEPREFAAGVLRLQLRVTRDITAGDLHEWPENSGFTAIHARPGLLEIQLDR